MEENKFEKQVQQKMGELKIHPTDSVWDKIEVRLEKKKPSNRGLIFFLLLLCVFLTGGYLLWNIYHTPVTGDHSFGKNNTNKNNSEKTAGEISSKKNKVTKPDTGLINNQASQPVINVDAEINKNLNKNSSQHYKVSAAKKINIKIKPGEKSRIVSSQQEEATNDISEKTTSAQAAPQPRDIQPPAVKISEEQEDSINKKVSSDISPKPVLKEKAAGIKDSSLQAQSISTAKNSKNGSWKFGMLFSAGISGIGNNFPGLNNSSVYSNDPATGGITTTPGIRASPSPVKACFGFIAGVAAEKNISAKIKLVTGINFTSFNTKNRTGLKNDTTGLFNSQYSINTYRTFKNHFNFIELPIGLKIQVGRSKSLPLFWQGGFVVSELINTNALQFDQSSGYYYTGNSLFNKTQIGINTSISATLFSKQKTSILIGPYFYYSASDLANEGLYDKKHFVFTGIRTEIIFGK